MNRTVRRAPHGGYTLIELLVSLGVFAFVVLIAAAAYLSFIAYNREAQTSATIINSLSFSIDRMARDIRTGEQYACPGGTCSSTGDASLTFTDTAGCTVTYSLGSAAIKRTVTGGSACDTEPTGAITDPSVSVSSLLFYVRGLSAGDNTQPIATMVVKGTACVPNTDCTGNGLISFDIQTSATERFPDIANAAGGTGDTGGGGDGGGDTGGGTGSTTPQTVQIFRTSGSSWIVPDDWNSANNTIEVIGAGGGTQYSYGGGGGGGAYSKISNLALTPGALVAYQVGSGTVTATTTTSRDTWFSSTATVLAKGGGKGGYYVSGLGGSAASGVGTVKYSGGNGGAYSGGGVYTGGGGGGAAGPNGNGGDAHTLSTEGNVFGGDGDAGHGGSLSGNYGNAAGAPGTEWDSSHGSGSGANGYSDAGPNTDTGGVYGGGAGGNGNFGSQPTGFVAGANGLIVITYTPAP